MRDMVSRDLFLIWYVVAFVGILSSDNVWAQTVPVPVSIPPFVVSITPHPVGWVQPTLDNLHLFLPVRSEDESDLYYGPNSQFLNSASIFLSEDKAAASSDLASFRILSIRLAVGNVVTGANSSSADARPSTNTTSPSPQDQAASAQKILTSGGTIYVNASAPVMYYIDSRIVFALNAFLKPSANFSAVGSSKLTSFSFEPGAEVMFGANLVGIGGGTKSTAFLFAALRTNGIFGSTSYFEDIGYKGPLFVSILTAGLRINEAVELKVVYPLIAHKDIRNELGLVGAISVLGGR